MNDHRRGNGIGAYHFCIILLLIMALTPSAAAADTMFRANPERTGVFDNGGIVPTNTELWRFAMGSAVSSSPSVANGIVYVERDNGNYYTNEAVSVIWATIFSNSMIDLHRLLDPIHNFIASYC